MMKMLNKRMVFALFFLAGIFSICTVFGKQIAEQGWIAWDNSMFVNILLCGIIYFVGLLLVESICAGAKCKNTSKFFCESKKFMLLSAGLILLSWGTIFLACFPGLSIYDGPAQLAEYHSGQITSHHPYIHTLFLVICEKISGGIFSMQFNFSDSIFDDKFCASDMYF